MSIGKFLMDKWYYIMTQGIVMFVVLGNMILFRCNSYITYLVMLGMIGAAIVPMGIEYGKKRSFYQMMDQCKDSLDKKYLICELLPKPSFLEGKIVYEALNSINQNMMDELAKDRQSRREYKEYIDLWVHEVKTPVTNVLLIADNHPDEVTKSIREEMEKIEAYIEQTLYYSKANLVEKDYCISKQSLTAIVKTAIKANKKALIGNRIQIELNDLDVEVLTDSKWLVFVLNQIIINCVKYKADREARIQFYTQSLAESIILCIEDNGIGIKESEVKKVLEKGFVGTNGRKREATTGMGLYLCSRLLTKMHHTIEITSKEGEFTRVEITFPKTAFFLNQ